MKPRAARVAPADARATYNSRLCMSRSHARVVLRSSLHSSPQIFEKREAVRSVV